MMIVFYIFQILTKVKMNLLFLNLLVFCFLMKMIAYQEMFLKLMNFQNMKKFLNYEKINFKQSKIQIISNYISLFSIIFSLLFVFYYLSNYILRLKKIILQKILPKF